MESAWDIRKRIISAKLPAQTRLIGIAILEHRNNKTGLCFPSHVTIADLCGVSTSSVKRAIVQMKSIGLIGTKRTQKACHYDFPAQLFNSSWTTQGDLSDRSTRVNYPSKFREGIGEDIGDYDAR